MSNEVVIALETVGACSFAPTACLPGLPFFFGVGPLEASLFCVSKAFSALANSVTAPRAAFTKAVTTCFLDPVV